MRRICLESGRATGLLTAPKRRVRCIVCDSLVKIVDVGEHLVVGRHYAKNLQRSSLGRRIYEGRF